MKDVMIEKMQTNMAIAGVKFLARTIEINKQMEEMTDEEYQNNPVGLDIQENIKDLVKYCPRIVVDIIINRQKEMIEKIGEKHIKEFAAKPYI